MLTTDTENADNTRARVEAEEAKIAGPEYPTDLAHPQAAPQHEQKQSAIPQRVNATKKGETLRFRYGLPPPMKATPVPSRTAGREARPRAAETGVWNRGDRSRTEQSV
jgi:hypothetical protein